MKLKRLISKSAYGVAATAVASLALTALASTPGAYPHVLSVRVDKPGAKIAPTMYGLFFEDINFAADGGLYAELVKNRSFDFPQPFMGWDTYGKIELKNDGPFSRNPNYVRLYPSGHREKHTGVQNHGFFGIPVKKGETYRFTVWARCPEGTGKVRVVIADIASGKNSQNVASAELTVDSKDWKKYTLTLTPAATVEKAVLRLLLQKPEKTVDLEHISLFPEDTWMGHENGLRKDLAQKLADLKPGIFRFPGGCIVEGADPDTRYQWKNTVGPVENRPVNENRWHYTFTDRFYPDYFQSNGLGFYEYFQLSEEIGAEPLPVLNVGMVCQYQNDLDHQIPLDSLDTYINDAIDLVEFANGDTSSKWGSLRAEMGHPAPFNLKFLAIGNEQWGPEYVERLEPFVKKFRKACPEIRIVGSSGPNSEGDQFDYLWPEMKRLGADLVDEHFYRPEDWFLSQGARYDSYDRKGPKVFAGEYACHGRGKKFNHFNAALCEAAFMTGLERNADIVEMATYAPLFAHTEGWQWRPDMIWYDNLRSYPTASYFVQQLYSQNKGTEVLPATLDNRPATGADGQDGIFASAVADSPAGDYIVKVANTSDRASVLPVMLKGLRKWKPLTSVTVTSLSSSDPDAENSIENPTLVQPVVHEEAISSGKDKEFTYLLEMQPKTFYVLRFHTR